MTRCMRERHKHPLANNNIVTLVRQTPAVVTSRDTISGVMRIDVGRTQKIDLTSIIVSLRWKAET